MTYLVAPAPIVQFSKIRARAEMSGQTLTL